MLFFLQLKITLGIYYFVAFALVLVGPITNIKRDMANFQKIIYSVIFMPLCGDYFEGLQYRHAIPHAVLFTDSLSLCIKYR